MHVCSSDTGRTTFAGRRTSADTQSSVGSRPSPWKSTGWTLRELSDRLDVGEEEVFTHGLEALLDHMPPTLQRNLRATTPVWRAWASQVNRWLPSWRYEHRRLSINEGAAFLEAVETVFKWLDANRA